MARIEYPMALGVLKTEVFGHMKITAALFSLLLGSSVAAAVEVTECAGAKVSIAFSKSADSPPGHEAVLTVTRNGKETLLRYDRNIDFIGAACRKNRMGDAFIVFQAYCGGSGCKDLDNYGIIAPGDLRILLVPNDRNSADAARIFGGTVAPISDVFSLEEDGRLIRDIHPAVGQEAPMIGVTALD